MIKLKTMVFLILMLASFVPGLAQTSPPPSVSQRLASQCQAGNPKTIARFCQQYVNKTIDRQQLDAQTIETLLADKELALACDMGLFYAHICPKDQFTISALKDKEFAAFLLSDPSIYRGLAFAKYGSRETIDVLYQLWKHEEKKLSGVYLNLALGIALTASDLIALGEDEWLKRYLFYKTAHQNGTLFAQFDTLEPWEMTLLFRLGMKTDEIEWGHQHVGTKKKFTADRAGNMATGFIRYRMKNKDGVSVHAGDAFYDGKPRTLPIYVEYGGVCGAVSTSACRFVACKGVPGFIFGQPGHCAFTWKGTDGEWRVGNDVYGWAWSGGRNSAPWEGPPPMIAILGRFKGFSDADKSDLCRNLARYSTLPANRETLLKHAVTLVPKHLPAWQDWLRLKTKGATAETKVSLLKEALNAFSSDALARKELVATVFPFDPKKQDRFMVASLILNGEDDKIATTLYMQTFWQCAKIDIPDLNRQFGYDVKNARGFFDKWLTFYKEQEKLPAKVRRQTCALVEQNLMGLLDHPETAVSFLNFYAQCQTLWNDKALMNRADQFIRKTLPLVKNPRIVERMIKAGGELALSLEDKSAMKFYSTYAQQLTSEPVADNQ